MQPISVSVNTFDKITALRLCKLGVYSLTMLCSCPVLAPHYFFFSKKSVFCMFLTFKNNTTCLIQIPC